MERATREQEQQRPTAVVFGLLDLHLDRHGDRILSLDFPRKWSNRGGSATAIKFGK